MTVTPRRIDLTTLDLTERATLARRQAISDPAVALAAAEIVANVARDGDAALAAYGERFGGSLADRSVLVPRETIEMAAIGIPAELRAALQAAITNVETVHLPQRPTDTSIEPIPGVRVDRMWTPLSSVGVYVPGGRALYPSSLIMGVVPARIAGVDRIVVATPASPDGLVDPVVLAAAHMLSVDGVYAMGGAQAVSALAYGTATVGSVDKIVGPGGPWVTAAKLAVYGVCGVDLPAGPSEAMIVADDSADSRIVAADVMCQAEHGNESAITLIVLGDAFADAVIREIDRVLPTLDRSDIIAAALSRHSMIVRAASIEDALAFADEWAPEHLSIHTADAQQDSLAVRSAGSVFVGHWTPEAAGDYATGANHVLPTAGLARAYGPLSVEDFGSWRQVQTIDRVGLEALAPTIRTLAYAEGLGAHAYSLDVRLEASP
jgi:histidinol dehydrogenase